MDLADFLLARIAEDEAAARRATPGVWAFAGGRVIAHREDGTPYWVVAEGPTEINSPWAFNRDHIAHWDPARVLAECQAKRRIVELHQPYNANERPTDPLLVCETCAGGGGYNADWPCATLRLLTLPYAAHPDYRQEWRP